jgi:hypothetical protein
MMSTLGLEHSVPSALEQLRLLEARHQRLQVVVGELLQTNQELRFQVATLEQRAESAERGLASASTWAAILF